MRIKNLAVRYCKFLDRKGTTFNIVAGLSCTALLGVVDYYSDICFRVDYTLVLFYLLPVAFVAWFAGRKAALALALVCTATKLSVQVFFPEPLSLLIWKNATAFAFFLVVGILLAKIRKLLDQERALSRIDHLTGALSRRAFLEITTTEIYRLRRDGHPFTLAYIDLDQFKEVNDTHDHSTGDLLLQSVVATIAAHLRRTDVVSRLGGDEFAILFTNCDDKAAHVAIHKIREQLDVSMKGHKLAVTFSIGVITCIAAPKTVDEIITLADNLMYEVKRNGKNGIRHAVYASCGGESLLP
jgi:diguanylate cyclase (GGDEF)-like protein